MPSIFHRTNIDEIVIGHRFRKDLGDIDGLARSMEEIGLLQPIGIDHDDGLVFGRRRLKAAVQLGWDSIPTRLVRIDSLIAERDENEARKQFATSERVQIKRAIEDRIGERRGRPTEGDNPPDLAEIPEGVETRDHSAKSAGFGSHSTARQAEKVIDAGVPEVVDMMDKERLSIDLAAKLVERPKLEQRAIAKKIQESPKQNPKAVMRKHDKDKIARKIAAEPRPMPEGPYRVITVDPPWQYEKRVEDATHRAALTYPDMTTDEICALPVGDRAHEDCILWLWTTNAHMRDAFKVMDAWGFQQKTILTWAKDRMGTGDWLRGKTEHCLMGVRGRPLVQLTNQTTLLAGDVREHSRKPESFYEMVDGLCPGSKLELFAREAREGWHIWGGEESKFDE